MEKTAGDKEAEEAPPLPPPPVVPPNVKPELASPKFSIISRRGTGSAGRCIPLLANHFKVSIEVPDAVFYQYSVCFFFFSSLSLSLFRFQSLFGCF